MRRRDFGYQISNNDRENEESAGILRENRIISRVTLDLKMKRWEQRESDEKPRN
jgi:hypothetical protein